MFACNVGNELLIFPSKDDAQTYVLQCIENGQYWKNCAWTTSLKMSDAFNPLKKIEELKQDKVYREENEKKHPNPYVDYSKG